MSEKFEQQPFPAKEKEELKTIFETKEGEKFLAERLTNPEDPRVEKVQEMLEKQLSKEEVDPPEVMKEAMTGRMATGEECPKYLIHVAENSRGEVKGLHTSAVVETVDSKGEESEKSAVWLGCYAVTSPEARGKGIWKNLFKEQEQAANEDAKRRGLEIKGFITEPHNELEPILNKEGIKRAYIKTKEGYKELPYEQPPVDWNPKTGKPAEDAGTVPEHLMLKLSSGGNKLSGKALMEMVRGMYYYNNYREEKYFKTTRAYERHTKFVGGIEQKLADFIGKNQVRLLSRGEREAIESKGIKFFGHREKEDREDAKKAARAEKREQKNEWKEHFGELAEVQLAREKAGRELAKEKKSIEGVKIPAEGMKPEQVLKEVGIGKPAESFEEFQKGLTEKLEGARTYKGERLSEGEKLMMARNAYLKELGYSVKYKGLLLDKAEIKDENNKSLFNEKGKPIEFRSFYFSKTEKLVNDFLKEKLKEKLEGKPAKEMSDEQKEEAGFRKAVKEAENAQAGREAKISFLQEVKKFSKEKWSKLVEGFMRLGFGEKLGIGLREGKKMAIEGGKDLMAIGLTPAAAVEEAGRYVAGKIQIRETLGKSAVMQEKARLLERVPPSKRPEYYNELVRMVAGEGSVRASEEMIKGYEKIYKKGKILRLIDVMGGRLSRPIGRVLGPLPPEKV